MKPWARANGDIDAVPGRCHRRIVIARASLSLEHRCRRNMQDTEGRFFCILRFRSAPTRQRGGCRHEDPRRRRIGKGQATRDRRRRPRRPEGRRGDGRGEGDGHLPHRRIHPLRRRPRRPVPGDPRARGRRHRRRCRAGRDQREKGRPRHSALHARMPAVSVLPVAQDEPVHRHPRDPGPGRHARRHLALLARRQEAAPLHGHLDLRELHRAARDRGRQDSRGRAVRQGLLHRLRGDDRHRRGAQHREGRAGREVRRVRARRHRAQRDPGAASSPAPT